MLIFQNLLYVASWGELERDPQRARYSRICLGLYMFIFAAVVRSHSVLLYISNLPNLPALSLARNIEQFLEPA